jgi:hypothetical protein
VDYQIKYIKSQFSGKYTAGRLGRTNKEYCIYHRRDRRVVHHGILFLHFLHNSLDGFFTLDIKTSFFAQG